MALAFMVLGIDYLRPLILKHVKDMLVHKPSLKKI
jgi:hypothetical protein